MAKTNEVKMALRKKLEGAFMFNALDESEKEVIINAMSEVQVAINEVVIKQGDQGDCLYVVDQGNLVCTKIFSGNTEATFLRRY